MPNRILKEGICTSDQINELTWFEEALFYRMIVNCDDFGRFDGRIQVVKNRLFPLKENITAKQVKDGINKLASVGLIVLYEYDGKPFLHLPTWNDHQSVRAKRSKYPAPEDGVQSHEIICNQMHADESKCSRNPIQSESNPNPNPNPNTRRRVDDDFKIFWEAYPRKEGKQKAEAAFAKVTEPVQVLLDAIEAQKKSAQWAKDGGQFIPHPATWLNGKRWLDEVVMATETRKGVPMGATGDLGAAEMAAIAKLMGDKDGASKWTEEARRGGEL